MTKEEKAEEILRQGGLCDGISCDYEDKNECPIFKMCERLGGSNKAHHDKVVACRAFLGEPSINNDAIGVPRTNAPTKTLLDEFAMAAMEGLMAMPANVVIDGKKTTSLSGYATASYGMAFYMMKERARRDEIGNVKEVK